MTNSEFESIAKKAVVKMIKDRTAVEFTPDEIEMISFFSEVGLKEGIFKDPGYPSAIRVYNVCYDISHNYIVVNLYENTGFMMFEFEKEEELK